MWITSADNTQETKVSLDDMLKNAQDLKTRSNDELEWFLGDANKEKNYGAIAVLAKELDSRPKIDISKKLAEDVIKTDEENAKIQQEIIDNKNKQKIQQSNEVESLKNQLNDNKEQIWSLKDTVESLIQEVNKNRQENTKLLEDLRDAKIEGNPEKTSHLQKLLTELNQKNKVLETKYKQEEIKYPAQEIATLNTKRIKWRGITKKSINTTDGFQTTIKRPNVKINKNIRSRRKLNQVVKAFNSFQKDSDSAVKYILSQERYGRVDHITWVANMVQSINKWRYGALHKVWFVMSKAKFEEKFDQQQKKIIDQFKTNINPAVDSNEDKTIKALELRMKYYKQKYTQKHYW